MPKGIYERGAVPKNLTRHAMVIYQPGLELALEKIQEALRQVEAYSGYTNSNHNVEELLEGPKVTRKYIKKAVYVNRHTPTSRKKLAKAARLRWAKAKAEGLVRLGSQTA